MGLQSFFPLDALDEIWDLIESVSEGFLTCSLMDRAYLLEENTNVLCSKLLFVISEWL